MMCAWGFSSFLPLCLDQWFSIPSSARDPVNLRIRVNCSSSFNSLGRATRNSRATWESFRFSISSTLPQSAWASDIHLGAPTGSTISLCEMSPFRRKSWTFSVRGSTSFVPER